MINIIEFRGEEHPKDAIVRVDAEGRDLIRDYIRAIDANEDDPIRELLTRPGPPSVHTLPGFYLAAFAEFLSDSGQDELEQEVAKIEAQRQEANFQ